MSLRDDLARKRARTESRRFWAEGSAEVERELAEAEQGVQLARLLPKGDVRKAQRHLDVVRRRADEVSITVTVSGLSGDDMDALLSEYGPAGEDDGDAWPRARKRQFLAHALALCATDADLSAGEWLTELSSGRWTAGDETGLLAMVTSATQAEPAAGIPKG